MKLLSPQNIIAIAIVLAFPVMTYAGFNGPAVFCGNDVTGKSIAEPQLCNVPGPLWLNSTGSAQQHGIIRLTSGDQFQVNASSTSNYNFGNWGGAGSTQSPFKLNVNGGINVNAISPYTPVNGIDGRVQADRFCFNPGTGPSDCISAWTDLTGASGSYVQKAGDAMTGPLSVTYSDPTFASGLNAFSVSGGFYGASVSGTSYGISAKGNAIGVSGWGGGGSGTGVSGTGQQTGGAFSGQSYGISAYGNIIGASITSNSTGVSTMGPTYGLYATTVVGGTAVYGAGGNNGGYFSGSTYGVSANGGNKGLIAYGSSYGVDATVGGGGIAVSGQGGAQGGYFSGSTFGVNANSAGTSIIAAGGLTGINAQGTNYGVLATSNGAGIAVSGYNAGIGGQFTGFSRGVDATGRYYGVLASATDTSTGVAVKGSGGSVGGDFTGASYGVKGTGASYGGYFTSASYAGSFNQGASYGALNYGSSMGTYSVGGNTAGTAGGLFYDGNYGIYTYLSQTNGIGVQTSGSVQLDGTRGIEESANTAPMITRNFDNFNAGAKGGVGRWGLFLEPSTLVAGIPNLAGRAFNVGAYNADGTIGKNLLYVNQNGNVYIDTGGLTLGNGGVSNLTMVNGTAAKPGGGSWAVYSDARLKDVHGDFSRGLSDLMGIQPVSYNYKKDNAEHLGSDQTYIGVVAQRVQKAVPEAVTTNSDGYLQVNNDPIMWTMLNSIKELKTENDQLKARLDALEAKVK